MTRIVDMFGAEVERMVGSSGYSPKASSCSAIRAGEQRRMTGGLES